MSTPTTPVAVTPPTTQPVSGTVTVTGVATASNQTDGSQTTSLWVDGAPVSAAAPAPTVDAAVAAILRVGLINYEALGLNLGELATVNKFGKSAAGDVTTDYRPICYGTTTLQQPVYATGAAAKVYVVSASAADDVGSTGLQFGTLYGIDNTFEYVSEVIQMDGLTPVASVKSYYVIYRFIAGDTGSGHAQAGAISIKDQAGAVTYMVIPAADAQSQFCYMPIAPSHRALVLDNRVGHDAGKAGQARLRVRTWTDVAPPFLLRSPWRTVAEWQIAANTNEPDTPAVPIRIDGPAEIVLESRLTVGTGDAYGRFDVLIYDAR